MAHKKIIFLVVCCFMTAKINAGLFEWFSQDLEDDAKVLGSEDADPEVRQTVITALKAMSFPNPESTPIKKLTYPTLLGVSNTLGIWIKHNESDITYTCFHEAAHHACGHDLKTKYLLVGTKICLIGGGLLGIFAFGHNTLTKVASSALFLFCALSSYGRKLLKEPCHALAVKILPRQPEIEADTLAVKTLCSLNMEHAVRKRLETEEFWVKFRLKYLAKMNGLDENKVDIDARCSEFLQHGRTMLQSGSHCIPIISLDRYPARGQFRLLHKLLHEYGNQGNSADSSTEAVPSIEPVRDFHPNQQEMRYRELLLKMSQHLHSLVH